MRIGEALDITGPNIINQATDPNPELRHSNWPHYMEMMRDAGRNAVRGAGQVRSGADVLMVGHHITARHMDNLLQHYTDVGMPTPGEIIHSVEPKVTGEVMQKYPNHTLLTYSPNEAFWRLQPNQDMKLLKRVQDLEDKLLLETLAEGLIAVPKAAIFEPGQSPEEQAQNNKILEELWDWHRNTPASSLYVKAGRTSNGRDVIEVKYSEEELEAAVAEVGRNGRRKIEQGIPFSHLVSGQYYAHQGQAYLLAATVQDVNADKSHNGNLYDAENDWGLTARTQQFVNAIAQHGFEGIFGVDYGIKDNELYAFDVNARTNGATSPISMADTLQLPEWASGKMSLPLGLTAEKFHFLLKQNPDIVSTPQAPEGIITINDAFIDRPNGYVMLMLVGSKAVREMIRSDFEQLVGIKVQPELQLAEAIRAQ
jgi:hypothetical protein